MAKLYGIDQVANHRYAAIAALTYWVFRCRDRKRTPAMGIKTWEYLQDSIQNAAQQAASIEDYLQELADKLVARLRPNQLGFVLQTWDDAPVMVRLNRATREMIELPDDQEMAAWGWRSLVEDACTREGCFEWDLLDIARMKPSIIQVLCRLRFEEDKRAGVEDVADDDAIETEGILIPEGAA